jgi:hypothetical protein
MSRRFSADRRTHLRPLFTLRPWPTPELHVDASPRHPIRHPSAAPTLTRQGGASQAGLRKPFSIQAEALAAVSLKPAATRTSPSADPSAACALNIA